MAYPAGVSGVLVNRFDVSEIGKPTRTPQGFLRIPAFLTRAGIFSYTRADGTVVRELRPPDEVFKADSLATLAAAPLTHRHPPEMISPKNVRAHAIGHVSEGVRQDGERVAAHVTVQDESAIAAVERRELREISCGYQCRIDATSGTWDGQAYDQVQRDITYNHAALGPRNWGRAGSDVALRLDSSGQLPPGEAWTFFDSPPERRDDHADPAGGKEDEMDQITIRVDGLDVQVPKQWAQVIEKALKDRTDSIAQLTTAREQLQAKLDQASKDLTDTKAKLVEAQDTKRLDALVAERIALVDTALRVLPADHKFEGQTTRQIQEAVIIRSDAKFDAAGKSDEYVAARFDAVVAALPQASGGNRGGGGGGPAGVRVAIAPPIAPVTRHDEKPYTPPWMQPLSTSKDVAR